MPENMKALLLYKSEKPLGPDDLEPVKVTELPIPVPDIPKGEVLVRLDAAGFNHRDLFARQGLYPGLTFSSPGKPSIVGADGVGTVLTPNTPLSGKAVFLPPMANWKSDPKKPDGKEPFALYGNVAATQGKGTFVEYVVANLDELTQVPEHLIGKWGEAAAVPLASLTAYRAVFTKAEVKKGDQVLITGIGGGVALLALQFAVAAGATVYVTSGSEEKIERAIKLGAKAGINYKDPKWTRNIGSILPKDRPYFDAVVDSAGGPLAGPLARYIKEGGIVAVYGSTTRKDPSLGMPAVLRNIELRGSTMGSLAELRAAVALIEKNKIIPVVDTVYNNLEEAIKGYDRLNAGAQFGKLVALIPHNGGSL